MDTRHLWQIFWITASIQFAMGTSATNGTVITDQPHQVVTDDVTQYSWTSWGSWTACSRSCGGGVAVQERQCIPRSKVIPEGTLPPPIITVRVTRDVHGGCAGEARRYHECNTAPCASGEKDFRSVQCAAFDRRPFRGRFYTWVPYIDGDSPCTLNCRPLGQQFYASLSLVADGTPCTKPGYRAICVHGACKVVGRESVLALAGSREVRCGRRLVSGLFSRPRLPLGYSYVTTVPRGACRVNISEILPSENYIALKISNGSYIMNGEFAVSASGSYDAAGARFIYSRTEGLDTVFALGPIQLPIDIMVLYTQPNPSIKYEYFTESLPGEIDIEPVTRPNIPEIFSTAPTKHIRRHQSFDLHPRRKLGFSDLVSISKEVSSAEHEGTENFIGGRKFIWKILSYTQCSRSCGGGIQVGKYRCVEASLTGDREVSPVHCYGPTPPGRRRRCGNIPCPPRWRTAAWSSCPECGPATRTRIVGCVQDHSRGITKVSDQKCPPSKPHATETCNVPDCGEADSTEDKYIDKGVTRPKVDTFREGPVYTVSVNDAEFDIGPEYSFSAAGWLHTDWSECVGWCVGGGIRTRGIRCADPSGCAPRKSPEVSQNCTPKLSCEPHEGLWFTGDWSPCSSPCDGKQVRGVLCIGGSGRHLKDSACKGPKPANEKNCGNECSPSWYFSDWSQCSGHCSSEAGIQRRTVWCAKNDSTGASDENECKQQKPQAHRTCSLTCSPNVTITTLPPDLVIESQKSLKHETTTTTTTTLRTTTTTEALVVQDCEDQLQNCVLAVQARLCHYNYYVKNCCYSCRGR